MGGIFGLVQGFTSVQGPIGTAVRWVLGVDEILEPVLPGFVSCRRGRWPNRYRSCRVVSATVREINHEIVSAVARIFRVSTGGSDRTGQPSTQIVDIQFDVVHHAV